ncbi:hypothetical protein C7M84_017760 [Penaeus vannamei]|uniref:Uncharacterized protein n=1 Tax=Penaeus vannamei TaxID=6689 RepID=A0A3R7LVL5_PENVA|nr:hypothetical protein C7M84_017760 [Penaeus vannamei]
MSVMGAVFYGFGWACRCSFWRAKSTQHGRVLPPKRHPRQRRERLENPPKSFGSAPTDRKPTNPLVRREIETHRIASFGADDRKPREIASFGGTTIPNPPNQPVRSAAGRSGNHRNQLRSAGPTKYEPRIRFVRRPTIENHAKSLRSAADDRKTTESRFVRRAPTIKPTESASFGARRSKRPDRSRFVRNRDDRKRHRESPAPFKGADDRKPKPNPLRSERRRSKNTDRIRYRKYRRRTIENPAESRFVGTDRKSTESASVRGTPRIERNPTESRSFGADKIENTPNPLVRTPTIEPHTNRSFGATIQNPREIASFRARTIQKAKKTRESASLQAQTDLKPHESLRFGRDRSKTHRNRSFGRPTIEHHESRFVSDGDDRQTHRIRFDFRRPNDPKTHESRLVRPPTSKTTNPLRSAPTIENPRIRFVRRPDDRKTGKPPPKSRFVRPPRSKKRHESARFGRRRSPKPTESACDRNATESRFVRAPTIKPTESASFAAAEDRKPRIKTRSVAPTDSKPTESVRFRGRRRSIPPIPLRSAPRIENPELAFVQSKPTNPLRSAPRIETHRIRFVRRRHPETHRIRFVRRRESENPPNPLPDDPQNPPNPLRSAPNPKPTNPLSFGARSKTHRIRFVRRQTIQNHRIRTFEFDAFVRRSFGRFRFEEIEKPTESASFGADDSKTPDRIHPLRCGADESASFPRRINSHRIRFVRPPNPIERSKNHRIRFVSAPTTNPRNRRTTEFRFVRADIFPLRSAPDASQNPPTIQNPRIPLAFGADDRKPTETDDNPENRIFVSATPDESTIQNPPNSASSAADDRNKTTTGIRFSGRPTIQNPPNPLRSAPTRIRFVRRRRSKTTNPLRFGAEDRKPTESASFRRRRSKKPTDPLSFGRPTDPKPTESRFVRREDRKSTESASFGATEYRKPHANIRFVRPPTIKTHRDRISNPLRSAPRIRNPPPRIRFVRRRRQMHRIRSAESRAFVRPPTNPKTHRIRFSGSAHRRIQNPPKSASRSDDPSRAKNPHESAFVRRPPRRSKTHRHPDFVRRPKHPKPTESASFGADDRKPTESASFGADDRKPTESLRSRPTDRKPTENPLRSARRSKTSPTESASFGSARDRRKSHRIRFVRARRSKTTNPLQFGPPTIPKNHRIASFRRRRSKNYHESAFVRADDPKNPPEKSAFRSRRTRIQKPPPNPLRSALERFRNPPRTASFRPLPARTIENPPNPLRSAPTIENPPNPAEKSHRIFVRAPTIQNPTESASSG